MNDTLPLLEANVRRVREQVAQAASDAGRRADEITLVAVTKYVDAEVTRLLAGLGCLDCGESRPQSLWDKAATLGDLPIRWHQIGHLQRNKLRRTLPLLSLVHSVDSQRLLDAVEEIATQPIDILLEINISGDAAKHGFDPTEAEQAVESALQAKQARLRGLMCMAGWGNETDDARRQFAAMRQLRDRLEQRYPEADLRELSMGMSGDFPAAIAEGATLVRVGSALVEGIV